MASLSVIIPCYNSRHTILRCLKSIETDVMDVEAIVIEDCSVIPCRDIVEKYAEKSKIQIKYMSNESNLGAGRTRNRGIQDATKKYITFLDSDDEFAKDYFEKIYDVLKNDYDMVVYDAIYDYKNGKKKFIKQFFSNSFTSGKIDQRQALVYIKGGTCGKIYRTDIIKKNNVMFGKTPRNEDMVFTKIATSFVDSVFYLEKGLYLYHDNEQSLMHDVSLVNPRFAIESFQVVKNNLINRGYDDELNSMLLIEVLLATTNALIQQGEKNKQIVENYKLYRSMYKKNDKYRKKYSISFVITFILFESRLFVFYNFLRKLYKNIR